MIVQCLSNKNKSTTVSKSEIFSDLNKALEKVEWPLTGNFALGVGRKRLTTSLWGETFSSAYALFSLPFFYLNLLMSCLVREIF